MKTVYVPETIDEALDLIEKGLLTSDIAIDYTMNRFWGDNRITIIKALFNKGVLRYKPNLEKLFDVEDQCYGDVKTTESGFKAYYYIPLDVHRFIELILSAEKLISDNIKFVDCGSGNGPKVKIASRLLTRYGNLFHGIEFDEEKLKNNVLRFERWQERLSIIKGDITNYDYSIYNMIYAYNPMMDVKGMRAFFKQVIKTAKPGAVCIFVNVDTGEDAIRSKSISKRFSKVSESIYIFDKEKI